METKKGLEKISNIANLTNNNYTPLLYGHMNGRLGKAKFHSIIIIMGSGGSSHILIGKHTNKLCNKHTQPVTWSTQGGEFKTKYTTILEFIHPELDAMKIVTWNFHVGESQENARYYMIQDQDIF